jgi:hypothetical protein
MQVMPSKHLLSVLSVSVPRTDVIDAGLWLGTPRATEAVRSEAFGKGRTPSPEEFVRTHPRKMIPTPTSSDHIERTSTSTEKLNPLTGKSVSLDRFVKFWPDEETQKSGEPKMWATPQAHDTSPGNPARVGRYGTKHGGRNLNDEAALWPTPNATDHKQCVPTLEYHQKRLAHPTRQVSLASMAALWPIPTGQDASNNGGPSQHERNSLPLNAAVMYPTARSKHLCGGTGNFEQLHKLKDEGQITEDERRNMSQGNGGSLNPNFVEYLMGFPKSWTEAD